MPVTINSRKYDLSIRRSWQAELIEHTDNLLVFVGEFDRDIDHADLGFIPRGTVSHEYYWLDRWYNVFRFVLPDGSLRNYYCNIAMPATFKDGVLDYVDLDIDVVVWSDFRHEILDLEDFEKNGIRYNYPTRITEKAQQSIAELIGAIERRDSPFDIASGALEPH